MKIDTTFNLKLTLLSLIIMFSISFGNELKEFKTSKIDSAQLIIKINSISNLSDNLTQTIHATAESELEKPLSVKVETINSKPVKNAPVFFSIISKPQKSTGTYLSKDTVFTNEEGIAECKVFFGDKKGDYEFSARINNNSRNNDIVYFKAYVRESNWVFYLISGLIGGLALFLFGMEMLSEGLKKTAGSKMRNILSTITNNRLVAVGVGALITMIIQSSSATTVMLVSFVQAQLMTFAQSLGIILGASIGTTFTVQLIAFKLTDFSLLIVGIGFAMFFLSKSKNIKNIGQGILGFGILFLGMWVMSDSMYPLRTYQPFLDVLLVLENPILGILIGTLFTGVIQSSAAFLGIVMVLGSQGLITLEATIPLILGSNLGTSMTAILSSINSTREAKRVALAHSLFKILGILLFIWWIPAFADLIRNFSPIEGVDLTSPDNYAAIPHQIANAHTFFNVILTIIILPFINLAAKLITKMLPDIEEEEEEQFKTKFLEDDLISTPAIALSLTKAEIIRMANKAKTIIEEILPPFIKNDPDKLKELYERVSELDFLNIKINRYLRKISQESLAEARSEEIFQMMNTTTEIKQIADVIEKRIIPLAKRRNKLNISFSVEGQKEITEYHLTTVKQISRAIEFFKDINLTDAKHIKKKFKKYRAMEIELRRTHFDRLLDEVPATIESSQIHLALIELLKLVSSHATNIALTLLESPTEKEHEVSLKAELHNIEKRKKKKKDVEE